MNKIISFLEQCVKNGSMMYDGIFTSSDVHAIVVLKQLTEMGIRVPEDVQIIGYDGMRILNVGDYPVSSIAQPVKEMAVTCVDTLIKLIEKKACGKAYYPAGNLCGGRDDKISRMQTQCGGPRP